MLYVIIVIIILLGIYLIFFYKSKKRLSKKQVIHYKKVLKEVELKHISNSEKIITYDKIYHNILKDLGYSGTFGEILKQKPKEIDDLNKIWELHKLRNKLVHELYKIDAEILEGQAKKYLFEIKKILN